MNDHPYRPIVIGFIMGMAFLIAFYVFTSVDPPETPKSMKSSAEVVDTYRECDIIRWSEHNMSTYKYFLYCEKNK